MEIFELKKLFDAVEDAVDEVIRNAKEEGHPGPQGVLLVLFHMQLTEKLKRLADVCELNEKKETEKKNTNLVFAPIPKGEN